VSFRLPKKLESSAPPGRKVSASPPIRVLAVIPGDGCGASFDFAKRQVATLAEPNLAIRSFFLLSRTSPAALFRECLQLRRNIHQFRPHLIHAHYGTMTSFLCAALTSTPLVITFRGSDLNGTPEYSRLRSWFAKLLSQLSCLRARRIICVSRELRNKLWWQRGRSVVIPTGVNLKLFRPQSKEQARRLLGWDMKEAVVVFNGKHQPRVKGSNFVEAAVRVAEEMVGHIKLVSLGVPFELMPACLNAADCLAMTSITEGSPNIVKEALACNLPIVSTDVGDVAERLDCVSHSRVVRRDVVEFGKAVAEFLAKKTTSNGRAHVLMCDENDVAVAIRRIYDEAVLACGNTKQFGQSA
jgi:teichuronic acid biosynthesis glycosyltransferase TuaC